MQKTKEVRKSEKRSQKSQKVRIVRNGGKIKEVRKSESQKLGKINKSE
jgi:hypothetical protein